MAKNTSLLLKFAGAAAIFLMALTSVTPVFAQSAPNAVMVNPSCAPSAPKGFGYYVIQKGDTPSSIATNFGIPLSSVLALNTSASFARNSIILLPAAEAAGKWDNALFCNTTASIPTLSQANLNMFNNTVATSTTNTTTTTVTIPVTGGTTQTVTVGPFVGAVISPTNCVAPNPPKGFGYYVVQKGDTPTSIAARVNAPLSTILALNSGASFARHTLVLLPSAEATGLWDNQLFCP